MLQRKLITHITNLDATTADFIFLSCHAWFSILSQTTKYVIIPSCNLNMSSVVCTSTISSWNQYEQRCMHFNDLFMEPSFYWITIPGLFSNSFTNLILFFSIQCNGYIWTSTEYVLSDMHTETLNQIVDKWCVVAVHNLIQLVLVFKYFHLPKLYTNLYTRTPANSGFLSTKASYNSSRKNRIASFWCPEQRPPVNKGHICNSSWLTVVDRFDCIWFRPIGWCFHCSDQSKCALLVNWFFF